MPRRIRILPDEVANQIAAGEVVERPASVVKELLENALDAGATRVDVSIRNGGKSEIRVSDDGIGMGREDALLALDRHATSKIEDASDLESVRTLGFRGEALPSIASVSRLTLESAESGGVGTRVQATAGRIHGVEECARQQGTTVTVRNLFHNVPARAKFLRAAAAETRAVAEVVTSLALARLSVGFRLESNGRELLDLPPTSDLAARIADLWGEDAAGRLVAASRRHQGVLVAGLVERPDAAGMGVRRVHLYVGGRPFSDRAMAKSAERAYRTTVPRGARPSLLLFIELDSGGVDVNVHPAKAEVRFRDRAVVEAAVEEAVREALARLDSATSLDRAGSVPRLRSLPATVRERGAEPTERQLAFLVSAPPRHRREGGTGPATEGRPGDAADGTVSQAEPGSAAIVDPIEAEEVERELGDAPVRPELWQVHDSYILAETRKGLLIVDQHSAHERVLFEEIMRRFDAGAAEGQRLLFPITLRLTPAEYAAVEEAASFLSASGYEVEPFGGRTVIVTAVPSPHPYFDAERCLREMISELASGSELTRAARNQHERIAMLFACKGAVKAGQKLSPQEMGELFDRLFATELPSHDVHGRPTIVRLPLGELERRFGRHG